MKLRTTAAAVAIAATATMGLTACGKEAPKAKDAWNKAQDAAGKYKSMEVKASGSSDGKPANMTLKGDVDGDPVSATGTLNGGKVELVTVGDKSYTKADAAFLKSQLGSSNSGMDAMVSKMANTWVEAPKSNSSSTQDDGFKELIKDLQDDSKEANKKLLSDKATVTEDKVDGKDAWKLESEDKKVKAWVSQEDSGEVLKTEGFDNSASTGNEMKTVTFVSHDKDYGIKAPSGAKKMTDLMKG